VELTIGRIAELLTATGPYGLVAILGWAFWSMNEKKDQQLQSLGRRVFSMAQEQTQALLRVESALVSLESAIARLATTVRTGDEK
jgi:hypothetical protein